MFENFVLSRSYTDKQVLIFASLLLFVIFLFGFVLLAIAVSYNPVFRLDVLILKNLQLISTPFLSQIMTFISLFGEIYFAPLSLLLVMGVLLYKGYKKEALFTPVVLIGFLFADMFKDLIARPRPTIAGLNGFYPVPADFSFPSGHVVFYTLLFGLLAFLALTLPRLERKWKEYILLAISIPLVSLVGLSRVYLGVHWPTDVIGGYLLGFALLELTILTYLKFLYLPQVRNK